VERARRSDAGRSRLPEAVERKLQELLSTRERPDISRVREELTTFCRSKRLAPPSRATLYNAMSRVVPPSYWKRQLPDAVQQTLHNVGDPVPGAQVVFHAFNYGDTRAISFAAGMPWASLARAAGKPGWRPKSLALLRAVMNYRGM